MAIAHRGRRRGDVMSRTKFDKDHKQFTEAAHARAREQVYPKLFNQNVRIDFDNTDRGESRVDEILDMRLGVDLRLTVTSDQFNQSIPIYVQERFRKPEYRHFQDITITKFNHASGEDSEVSKLAAQWLVYGYYESVLDEIQEAVCVNVPVLARAMINGEIDYQQEQNPKRQDFITIPFSQVEQSGAMVKKINRIDGANGKRDKGV